MRSFLKKHTFPGRKIQRLGKVCLGAGDEARTRYLHLGKVALYRMSYTRIWCLRSELNQRHADFQSAALPTELQRHMEQSKSSAPQINMATRNGLEPSTSSVTGWRANRLHHRAMGVASQQRGSLYTKVVVLSSLFSTLLSKKLQG